MTRKYAVVIPIEGGASLGPYWFNVVSADEAAHCGAQNYSGRSCVLNIIVCNTGEQIRAHVDKARGTVYLEKWDHSGPLLETKLC